MIILYDSREKHPYDLFCDKFGNYIECRKTKLNTGDYTIEGLEDVLCIERKESVTELAGNCTSKRFLRELERMSKYKYAYIVLEFFLSDILGYPQNLKLPPRIKNRIKISGNFILTRMCQWSLDYNFQIFPCGNRQNAEFMTGEIIKRIWQQNK